MLKNHLCAESSVLALTGKNAAIYQTFHHFFATEAGKQNLHSPGVISHWTSGVIRALLVMLVWLLQMFKHCIWNHSVDTIESM